MKKTSIAWTDFSSNPIVFHDAAGKKHWGCVKVSPGCAHCYADTLERRFGGEGAGYTVSNMAGLTASLDEAEMRRILRFKPKGPGRNPAGPMFFPFDMTDVFGPWVTDEMLDRLFAVMALRPDLIFQVLTKRPERMREYLTDRGRAVKLEAAFLAMYAPLEESRQWRTFLDRAMQMVGSDEANPYWPLSNVHLGVSVEDQAAAVARISELLATPAAVRFLSCEPLLGPLLLDLTGIDWVIVGGESGSHARPCDIAWIRDIVRQCQVADVPVFVKQLGSNPTMPLEDWRNAAPGRVSLLPTAVSYSSLRLKDGHGADPEEWPEDLRIREFPR